MEKSGTPTNIEEFVKSHRKNYSSNVRGLLGRDIRQIPKTSLILDAGCGIGNILFSLNSNGFNSNKLYGIDIEEKLVKIAKESISSSNFMSGTIESIPFKDTVFDYIACYDLLEHVPDPKKAIHEISRVLKKDGYIYMTVADGYSINDILFRLGGNILRGRSSHIQRFRKDTVLRLLELNGFKVIEIENIRACFLVYLPIGESLPLTLQKIIRSFGVFIGQFMNAAWELKAVKRVD